MVIILITKLFVSFFFVIFERMLNFIKTSFATVCSKIIPAFRTCPVNKKTLKVHEIYECLHTWGVMIHLFTSNLFKINLYVIFSSFEKILPCFCWSLVWFGVSECSGGFFFKCGRENLWVLSKSAALNSCCVDVCCYRPLIKVVKKKSFLLIQDRKKCHSRGGILFAKSCLFWVAV